MDMNERVRKTSPTPEAWQQLVGQVGKLFLPSPGPQQPAMPFRGGPMLDTMPPQAAPMMGGGGDMASIQRALQMLAQMLGRQQPGGGGSEFPGSGGMGLGY